MEISNSRLNIWIALTLLFMFFLNPFNYGFLFGYAHFAYILLSGNFNYKIGKPLSILLLFFSFIYALFYSFDPFLGTQFIFIYAIIPYTIFVTGRILAINNKNLIMISIFILGLALSTTSILSVLLSIINQGFVTIKRDVPNFWTGAIDPATNTAGSLILNMCIPGLLVLKWRYLKSFWLSFFALIIFVISVICILRLGSRTHLVIAIFSILVALIYRLSTQNPLKNIVMITVLFIISNIGLAYISFDSDSELLAAYADRMESKKYGASSAGGRTDRWIKSTELIFEKPFGWGLEEIGHSHNLWFDVGRVGGFLSFIFLLVFSVKSGRKTLKVAYNKLEKNKSLSGGLLIYIIALNLLFFVEPIMDGYFNCFAIFCFISGIIAELARLKVETSQQD